MRNTRVKNVMGMAFALLLTGMSPVAASSYAQTATVNVSARNATLESVLKQIEKQSDFLFFYNVEEINRNALISIHEENASIRTVLDEIARKTGLRYTIKDRHIVLTSEEAKPSSTSAPQQTRKVTGTVSDTMGPIVGANIVQKGTMNGTTTDMDGKFSIEVSGDATLEVSFIGYVSQTIAVKGQSVINVTLREDTQALDEVVVVGYGTMKKKDLTGAVASVKMDDAPVGTVSTISHALAGKAAGLQVSTVSAQPGGGSNFRIRGAASVNASNDPLIIIDGFPVSAVDEDKVSAGKYSSGTTDNILASINPNDIESIEVLKDASSTAIYGSRAGNGVIIVTTKRGKTGAPKVTYSGTASVQTLASEYDMLNATDFMIQSNRYQKEQWMKDNGIGIYGGKSEAQAASPYTPRYTDAQIANPANQTDWFDEITRMGFQTQHNVSISGGTETTKYLVSGNFFKQNGVVKNNGMERFTGRVNLEQQVSKLVKVGVNMTVSRNQMDNVPLGSGQNENASIMVAAAQFNPTLGIKDADGEYVLNDEAAFLPNPVSLLEITDKTTKERLLATAFVEVKPIQDLTLKANLGIDRNYQKHKAYLPKTTLYGAKKGGQADIAQYDKSDYLMELTANYTKGWGDHNLSALAGYSFQRFTDESLSAGNSQFLIDGFLYNNLGAGAYPKPSVGSSASKNEMASFFGRINYSFKDRYLLTATLRADGASNFAKNNRWGYFPSVAAGWRFTEEEFLEPLTEVMSSGKLRLSYGQTGNSNIGNKAISYYQTGRQASTTPSATRSLSAFT